MVKKSTTIDTKLRDILTLLVLYGQIVQKRLNLEKCPGGRPGKNNQILIPHHINILVSAWVGSKLTKGRPYVPSAPAVKRSNYVITRQ